MPSPSTRTRSCWTIAVATCGLGAGLVHAGPAPGLWADADFAGSVSFGPSDVALATSYFYWYDIYTGEHFIDPDGSDALTHHPPRRYDYSYRSVAWHKRQMLDIMAAGIDVILPVYWGSPANVCPWSDAGLPPLVQAQQELIAEGKRPPQIGMFYDTSTLAYGPSEPMDLTTDAGREWFYATFREFWRRIPPHLWAMIDGKPIVYLYGANCAKAYDQTCIDYVRRGFARDFAGRTPYIVREVSWQVETESEYAWGGCFGPIVLATAAIGPGYDQSAVQGRQPLALDREGGARYERGWRQLLSLSPRRRPKLVHIETWNELHEATEVCETVECGRRYIEMTRRFGDLYRAGVQLIPPGPYHGRGAVACDLGAGWDRGLRHRADAADGPTATAARSGAPCRVMSAGPYGPGHYAYFDVDDSLAFDPLDGEFVVRVVYFDEGPGAIGLEYDSTDPTGSVRDGAFKSAGSVPLRSTGQWVAAEFRLPDARMANRTNGGDFRIVAGAGKLAIRAVRVSRP